jgi:hypothetical protein
MVNQREKKGWFGSTCLMHEACPCDYSTSSTKTKFDLFFHLYLLHDATKYKKRGHPIFFTWFQLYYSCTLKQVGEWSIGMTRPRDGDFTSLASHLFWSIKLVSYAKEGTALLWSSSVGTVAIVLRKKQMKQ